MKKLSLPAIALISLLCGPAAFGHPPDSLSISFDSTGTVLSVTVSHPVRYADRHYIDRIIVRVDGKVVIEQTYGLQATDKVQEAFYRLVGLRSGMKVEVTAGCNITGKKTAAYTVP